MLTTPLTIPPAKTDLLQALLCQLSTHGGHLLLHQSLQHSLQVLLGMAGVGGGARTVHRLQGDRVIPCEASVRGVVVARGEWSTIDYLMMMAVVY